MNVVSSIFTCETIPSGLSKLIDFDGISTRLVLFYANMFGKSVYCSD